MVALFSNELRENRCNMTKLEKIEQADRDADTGRTAAIDAWLRDFKARQFDEQIERDIKAGKLDELGQRALAAHRAGRTKPL